MSSMAMTDVSEIFSNSDYFTEDRQENGVSSKILSSQRIAHTKLSFA